MRSRREYEISLNDGKFIFNNNLQILYAHNGTWKLFILHINIIVDQYGVIHAQILISVSWKFYRAFVCLFLDYQAVQLNIVIRKDFRNDVYNDCDLFRMLLEKYLSFYWLKLFLILIKLCCNNFHERDMYNL